MSHPGSRAAADDPNAVVQRDLRVRGVAGLPVADASTMPPITSGNTNAPTITIGERSRSTTGSVITRRGCVDCPWIVSLCPVK
ncbi:GMC oxidoreductase [Mycobacterium simiae]|uniref:GMC oxidoreductase n=1 Tax=Mycobacterium simiae TaxID=1784 RepID=UPI0033A8235F